MQYARRLLNGFFSVRAFFLSLALLALTLSAACGQSKPLLTVHVTGDQVEYDQDAGTLKVYGKVAISAATDKPGVPTASITAENVEANLRTGQIQANEGVRLLSQQMALTGEKLELNLQTDDFRLEQGAASIETPSLDYPGRVIRGFFFGDQIGQKARVLYIIEGRVTTCDRRPPHYSIGARTLTYDTATATLTVEGGRLQLYGAHLAIPGRYRTRLVAGGTSDSLRLPLPGYSSYDGLYVPLSYSFSRPQSDWQLSLNARLGTRLQLPAVLTLEDADDNSDILLKASHNEEIAWFITKRSRLNRLPEAEYTKHILPVGGGLSRLDLGLSGGYFKEYPQDLPSVKSARGNVRLSYISAPRERIARQGTWWGAELNQSYYGTGDRLRDVRLELGRGWDLGQGKSAALWGVHHFTHGESPFQFDRIFFKNEIDAAVTTRFAQNYGLDLFGRYDVDGNRFADYSIRATRQVHCLTWSVQYDYAYERLSFGVDLSGITGHTPPPQTRPLVAPDEMPPLPTMVPLPEGTRPPFQLPMK